MSYASNRILGFSNISEETRFLLRCAANFTFSDSLRHPIASHIICAYIKRHIKDADLPTLSKKYNAQQEKRLRMLFKQSVSLKEKYDGHSANKILNIGASKIIDAEGHPGLSTLLKSRFKKRNLNSSSQALEL